EVVLIFSTWPFHSTGGVPAAAAAAFCGSGATFCGASSNLFRYSCLGEFSSTYSVPSPVIWYSLLSLKQTNFFCCRNQSVKRRCSRGKDIMFSRCKRDRPGSSGFRRRL